MSINVYFEVPIVTLSLSLWVTRLSQVYGAFASDVEVEASTTFFAMQLLLTTLWIVCATLTRQWLVLITTCNGFLCQSCILYFLHETKKRKRRRHSCEMHKLASSPYDTPGYIIARTPYEDGTSEVAHVVHSHM